VTRVPFTADPDPCPKCRNWSRPEVEYRDLGRRMDGTAVDECLIITCRKCGFDYDMECADATDQ
jgi:hypothetical protein